MALLDVQDVAVAGLEETRDAAAGGGDTFSNNGLCILHVVNGDSAPHTVTVDDPNSSTPVAAAAFNPDVAVVVPAGEERFIGPFPPFRFNDADGLVHVSYSAVTSVEVAVLRVRT